MEKRDLPEEEDSSLLVLSRRFSTGEQALEFFGGGGDPRIEVTVYRIVTV